MLLEVWPGVVEDIFECGDRNKFLVGVLGAYSPRKILDPRKPIFCYLNFHTKIHQYNNLQYSDFNLYKQLLIVCVKILYFCAQ